MVENGAKHSLGSTELLYLPRRLGGIGLKSVEAEYKATKIKAVINLYANRDSTWYGNLRRKQFKLGGDR